MTPKYCKTETKTFSVYNYKNEEKQEILKLVKMEQLIFNSGQQNVLSNTFSQITPRNTTDHQNKHLKYLQYTDNNLKTDHSNGKANTRSPNESNGCQ